MKLSKLSINTIISIAISALLVLFAFYPTVFFPLFSMERSKVLEGEAWRILTAHFVHFGWTHLGMNLAAFAIFIVAFANKFSPIRFAIMIVFCCLVVGAGIYFWNPEYGVYSGMSGALHGFFVAGLLTDKSHNRKVNGFFVALLFIKVIAEKLGYQPNSLQHMLPVAVAYDAHWYGAAAGLIFGGCCLLIDAFFKGLSGSKY